jgi:hypothetical protein
LAVDGTAALAFLLMGLSYVVYRWTPPSRRPK